MEIETAVDFPGVLADQIQGGSQVKALFFDRGQYHVDLSAAQAFAGKIRFTGDPLSTQPQAVNDIGVDSEIRPGNSWDCFFRFPDLLQFLKRVDDLRLD